MTIVQISFGVVHQYLQPQEGIYHCTRKAESNFPADIRLPINMSKSATEKDISTEEYPLEKKIIRMFPVFSNTRVPCLCDPRTIRDTQANICRIYLSNIREKIRLQRKRMTPWLPSPLNCLETKEMCICLKAVPLCVSTGMN